MKVDSEVKYRSSMVVVSGGDKGQSKEYYRPELKRAELKGGVKERSQRAELNGGGKGRSSRAE